MRRLLVLAALLVSLALLAARPGTAGTVVINNGLAPPNAENVIDAGNSYPVDDVYVQNVGCDRTVVDPCPLPWGDPTSVEVTRGGEVGGGLVAYESSTVTMSGGEVNWIYPSDSSTVTMSGGSVANILEALSSSTVTMSGGSVGGEFEAFEFSTITVRGTGFAVDGVPVGFGPIAATEGRLTGTLESGEPLDNEFLRSVTAVIIVPEPAQVLLVLTGGLVLAVVRRERRAQVEDTAPLGGPR
jgi:hypothetical protein